MMETAEAAFGGLDILVNNAALMVEAVGTPAIQTSIADFDRLMRINLTGALICSKAAVPLFEARGGGKIVTQLSAGGLPAPPPSGTSPTAHTRPPTPLHTLTRRL